MREIRTYGLMRGRWAERFVRQPGVYSTPRPLADNEWSPDGRRIVFRQSAPDVPGSGRIRVLTFDDCHGDDDDHR